MITVEPMRWWHIEAVSSMEESLFPHDAWSREQFWQELGQDTRRYVVASDAGAVVGYAGAFLLPPDSDVQTIAVRTDRQGEGVASGLMNALIDHARDAGCTHLMLEVRADNDPAVRLYERFGFDRISQRRGYYPDGGDALIMRRRIEVVAS